MVARRLGTCTTALKKVCRRLNIGKWPYRQIMSIAKSIQSLEMASLSGHMAEKDRMQNREQVELMLRVLAQVIRQVSIVDHD